jgi:hypothetical protein
MIKSAVGEKEPFIKWNVATWVGIFSFIFLYICSLFDRNLHERVPKFLAVITLHCFLTICAAYRTWLSPSSMLFYHVHAYPLRFLLLAFSYTSHPGPGAVSLPSLLADRLTYRLHCFHSNFFSLFVFASRTGGLVHTAFHVVSCF